MAAGKKQSTLPIHPSIHPPSQKAHSTPSSKVLRIPSSVGPLSCNEDVGGAQRAPLLSSHGIEGECGQVSGSVMSRAQSLDRTLSLPEQSSPPPVKSKGPSNKGKIAWVAARASPHNHYWCSVRSRRMVAGVPYAPMPFPPLFLPASLLPSLRLSRHGLLVSWSLGLFGSLGQLLPLVTFCCTPGSGLVNNRVENTMDRVPFRLPGAKGRGNARWMMVREANAPRGLALSACQETRGRVGVSSPTLPCLVLVVLRTILVRVFRSRCRCRETSTLFAWELAPNQGRRLCLVFMTLALPSRLSRAGDKELVVVVVVVATNSSICSRRIPIPLSGQQASRWNPYQMGYRAAAAPIPYSVEMPPAIDLRRPGLWKALMAAWRGHGREC